MKTENLDIIENKLRSLKSKNRKKFTYFVPAAWINNNTHSKVNINPYEYFLNQIEKIRKITIDKENDKLSANLVVYNLFVRYALTFDHNNDGIISIEPSENFRETGTFLKAIALLPYIKELGCNTIHLLPVTSIGIDRKKGNLGSPYSIRNPYKIEPTLSEPFLELDAETEFKAFSEAVHLLGMNLICEFVFRTASVDSDLALEHTDWFYWIKAKINMRNSDKRNENQFGPPIFTKQELELIKQKVEAGDLQNLPEPHDAHKKMFTKAPSKLARVEQKIIGLINNGKTEVVIPSAFADWPPDDNQPLWSDVTYLKMYNHKEFNYIAYNTVRMYERKLSKEQYINRELWDYIINIIPFYIENFNIDGIMLDMGHALPSELRKSIVTKAREIKSDFIFWEENFNLTKSSVENGYNAVVGYLPFDSHIGWKVKDLLRRFENNDIPVDFFATAENHNTPRTASREGGINFAKCCYVLSRFIPTITFIHNGFELGETTPVNTGLGFTNEEIIQYPPEKLGLFSNVGMNWLRDQDFIDYIKNVNRIHDNWISGKNIPENNLIKLLETNSDNLIAFIRETNNSENLLIVINLSSEKLEYNFSSENITINNCQLTNTEPKIVENGYLIAANVYEALIFPISKISKSEE